MRLLLIAILIISSCAKQENLKRLSKDAPVITVSPILGSAEIEYCLLEDELATDVKTVFMLDRSGSNLQTDPDRSKRTNGILKYLNEGEFKDNEYFALTQFFCQNCSGGQGGANGITQPGVNPIVPGEGNGENLTPQNDFSPFMKNLASEGSPFRNVVQTYKDTADVQGRGTNFRKALETIKDLIETDADLSKQRYEEAVQNATNPDDVLIKPAVYKVVFASDGQPTDTSPENYESQLINYIRDEIIQLESDIDVGPFIQKIYFSAAFYHFEENIVAEKLIQDMAKVGGGKYLAFNNGEDIDFEKLLDVPIINIRTTEEHFLVTNKNTSWIWGEDSQGNFAQSIGKDTDGDGLADSLEIPACVEKADCDDNGLGDKVESYLYNSQCVISKNDDTGELYCDLEFKRDICEEEDSQQDDDNDGLNNCEERQLKTNEKLYDSNNDQIMDGLAFRFNLDLVAPPGLNVRSRPQSEVNNDDDEWDNYKEVKHFTPVDFANDKIQGLKPYKYTKTFIPNPSKPFHKCYSLIVNDIPMVSKEDTVEIHFVQKEANGTGRTFYRRLEKKMTNGVVKIDKSEL